MMISPKKLIKMARKWQRLVAIRRKRISQPGANDVNIACTTTTVADHKGHFVAYTIDHQRFVLPIEYLNSYVFRELLILSEEEFGLPGDGPITLPCDSVFMAYAANLIRHCATEDMQEALLMTLASHGCSLSYSLNQYEASQLLVPCV